MYDECIEAVTVPQNALEMVKAIFLRAGSCRKAQVEMMWRQQAAREQEDGIKSFCPAE